MEFSPPVLNELFGKKLAHISAETLEALNSDKSITLTSKGLMLAIIAGRRCNGLD